MGVPTIIKKSYVNHFGLDLRSNDLNRPIEFARAMNNCQYRESGSPEKVKGWQFHGSSVGGGGLFRYDRVDPVTGVLSSMALSVGTNLHRLDYVSIEVTYSGAEPNCLLSVFMDATTRKYFCTIDEGEVQVLNMDLGLGYDEVSPVTIAALKTAIDLIPNFAAVVVGTSTTSAAFLRIVRNWDLSDTGGPWTGEAGYWTQVNSPITTPFAAHYAKRNESYWEIASQVQVENCIYFATPYTNVLKFDGQNLYRAGVPKPATITSALGAAGAITGSNYFHLAQYVQYDAAGNVFSGNYLKTAAGVNATSDKIDVTVANVLAASGFNTNCAIVAGAGQNNVTTITVDNGSGGAHTMKIGDTAYFFDSVSSAFVTRAVTAVAATTITIAGAAVTVADNAVISNNLRISIFRNETSATTPTAFYLVTEVPNNSFTATQVVVDDTTDGSLGAQFIEPLDDRSLPPMVKYISQWNGVFVGGATLLNPYQTYWGSPDGFEYWPDDGYHEFGIQTGTGDTIVGIAPNNEVFTIHGEQCFTVVSGDIIQNILRFETKSRDAGLVAHSTIQELDGALVWISPRGPRMSLGGQVPIPLGPHQDASAKIPTESRIDPAFDSSGLPNNQMLRLKQATAVVDTTRGMYIVFLPAFSEEEALPNEFYANEHSRIFAYQQARDAWLEWSNRNMLCGAIQLRRGDLDELYFQERRLTEVSSVFSITHKLARRHNLEDAWDYADNADPTEWSYSAQWEFLGEASALKGATVIKLFCLEETPNSDFTVTVDQETNFIREVSKATFDMELPGGGYGVSPYGLSAYGDPSEGSVFHTLNRDRMRAISPVFSNDLIHENVVLSGWEIAFKPNRRPEVQKP